MPDLKDGETAEIKGSAKAPYILKNTGGVYSCTCPAWRNQSVPIERRTCKHLRAYRGEQAEKDRIGGELPVRATNASDESESAAPALLLAHPWTNDVDLTDWWMSEKLDGVRAYWDGRQFISRQGNIYHAPDFFTAGLPDAPLDGELWLGARPSSAASASFDGRTKANIGVRSAFWPSTCRPRADRLKRGCNNCETDWHQAVPSSPRLISTFAAEVSTIFVTNSPRSKRKGAKA